MPRPLGVVDYSPMIGLTVVVSEGNIKGACVCWLDGWMEELRIIREVDNRIGKRR